jgi:biotin-dependent carboxylase-like uncharacterized protein
VKTIEVITPGLLTTVQDLGRQGYGPLGVSACGAADALSLRVGNLLVGNRENAAGLEMTLLGGTFRFPHGGIVALTGSDFDASVDNRPLPAWTSERIVPGQTLRLGPTQSGARCYLCVLGGIQVPLVLGSSSTHLPSAMGGFGGRSLKKGDILAIGDAPEVARLRRVVGSSVELFAPRKVLRVTPGLQGNRFAEQAREGFFSASYRVREDSNRMGIRLEGPSVPSQSAGEMITEGVSLGAVQVPDSGQPILSFVDQQTTGGYPVIANIITADFSSVGQLRPRHEIQFELVDLDRARVLLLEQEKLLASQDFLSE